jgi:hypothetical protein
VNVLLPGEPLLCPQGHPIPTDQWAWPHGGVRCKYREPPAKQHGVCGAVLYWMVFPGGVRAVVQVTSAELFEMERAHMDIDQAREYLGLKWRRAA